jgi:hypothetical protein
MLSFYFLEKLYHKQGNVVLKIGQGKNIFGIEDFLHLKKKKLVAVLKPSFILLLIFYLFVFYCYHLCFWTLVIQINLFLNYREMPAELLVC